MYSSIFIQIETMLHESWHFMAISSGFLCFIKLLYKIFLQVVVIQQLKAQCDFHSSVG